MLLLSVVSAYCSIQIPSALNLDYKRIQHFWIIVEITNVLREYQLSFSEGSEFFLLFGLGRTCEDTVWDFLQNCLVIPSSMWCDSCGSYMHIIVRNSVILDRLYGIVEMVGIWISVVPLSLCATAFLLMAVTHHFVSDICNILGFYGWIPIPFWRY